MRRLGTIIAVVVLLAACTSTPETTVDPSATPSPSVEPTPEREATALVSADQLTDCDPAIPKARQTVAFAAGGSIWALDPRSGVLTCSFEATQPGPFIWGPLGDQVVTDDGGIVAVGSDTGPFVIIESLASPSTWSRPTGRSFVFVAEDATQPTKYPVTDDVGSFVLTDLPSGSYEAIAYHPSGTSMAVSVLDGEEPQIFLATNEGARDARVVVGVSATSFPSVAFTDEGSHLVYLSEHKGGYVQVHALDLESPDALLDGWRSSSPVDEASGLLLSGTLGGDIAITTGGRCRDAVAMVGGYERLRRALPDAGAPTRALGFTDDRHLLVGVGGCDGGPMDLVLVGEDAPVLLVENVDAGASRAPGSPEPAAPLPEGLLGEIREFG